MGSKKPRTLEMQSLPLPCPLSGRTLKNPGNAQRRPRHLGLPLLISRHAVNPCFSLTLQCLKQQQFRGERPFEAHRDTLLH